MFKVSKKDQLKTSEHVKHVLGEIDPKVLLHFCQIEEWSANISTGEFHIGPITAHKHGLSYPGDCGLLQLLKSYKAQDYDEILNVFETIAGTDSFFSFSTEIEHADMSNQPVICIGETHLKSDIEGDIKGIFIFPRFPSDIFTKTRQ